jgi:predicted CXXCH cytochrome family protein
MIRFPLKALYELSASIAFLAAAIAIPASAHAQDNIKVTKHNFSTISGRGSVTGAADISAGAADYGEICVYCHTPHGGQTGAPLWNRSFGATPYQMYTVANSATIDMVVASTPGNVSLACLSCHDGTIGIDVITNPPNVSSATSIGLTMGGLFPSGANALKNLSTDLRNDHPIGVTFATTGTNSDAAFNALATIKLAGLKFYGPSIDQVECATCHNPHSSTNVPFLRIANAQSALCLTCHIK